jgi:restriction system protein
MPVPDFQSFFIPMLRRASDGNEYTMTDFREAIAAELELTPEELSQRLPSGGQTVFVNRVAWSAVYLTKAGALERIKRGVFRIANRGNELLALGLPKLTIQNLSKYPEFQAFQNTKGEATGTDGQDGNSEKIKTPEEQLANAYKVLRDTFSVCRGRPSAPQCRSFREPELRGSFSTVR